MRVTLPRTQDELDWVAMLLFGKPAREVCVDARTCVYAMCVMCCVCLCDV
jgi:hypothetical protein